MNRNTRLPDDCSKQWEILLLLMSAEERRIDRTNDSEIDTMNYFLNNEGVRQILLQWLQQMKDTYAKKSNDMDTSMKSDSISVLWRLKGNDNFRANLITESYKCYTNSIIYAQQSGPVYALALANRSATLLRMKRYQECLSDIRLALAYRYPEEQKHKLLLREADCLIALGQRKAAIEALSAAISHASTLQNSAAYNADFERHVSDLQRKLEVTREENPVIEDTLPELYMGENKNYCSASTAVELRWNDAVGRHVVTCHAIKRGDVIYSEEPYACVTLPTDIENAVCENCCMPDINVVPCSGCSLSWYCGEACRVRAAESHHQWECIGVQSKLFKTIGIAHLALRVLLVSTSSGFPRVPKNGLDPKTAEELFQSYSNVGKLQIYSQDTPPFFRMFNLVTNFEKMTSIDYIQYALTATMLTLYLENYTSYFDYLPSKMPGGLFSDELRLFAAGLILRGMGQLVCNGHAALALATVDENAGRTVTEREYRRATAIYPSAAMMNHSCDPNIINTFYRGRLIVRCLHEVAPGSEVFNCYGPHRSRETTPHRREQLRAQYMFNCLCTACTDTERRDFVSIFSAYACQMCKGPIVMNAKRSQCPHCKTEFNLIHALEMLEDAEEVMAQAKSSPTPETQCEKLQIAYKMRQQVLHRHHKTLRRTADKLARVYADLGEYSKCVELIKQNIQSSEYQYGSFSVEVAHELRKLADVMLERLVNKPHTQEYKAWCLEAHKIIKKAIQLMELNYGPWESLVKRLQEKEVFIASLTAEVLNPSTADDIHNSLHYNLKI